MQESEDEEEEHMEDVMAEAQPEEIKIDIEALKENSVRTIAKLWDSAQVSWLESRAGENEREEKKREEGKEEEE